MNVTRIASESIQTEPLRTLARRARNLLRPRKRRHDPLLVLSLATFNSGGGWAQVLTPLKVRESVG